MNIIELGKDSFWIEDDDWTYELNNDGRGRQIKLGISIRIGYFSHQDPGGKECKDYYVDTFIYPQPSYMSIFLIEFLHPMTVDALDRKGSSQLNEDDKISVLRHMVEYLPGIRVEFYEGFSSKSFCWHGTFPKRRDALKEAKSIIESVPKYFDSIYEVIETEIYDHGDRGLLGRDILEWLTRFNLPSYSKEGTMNLIAKNSNEADASKGTVDSNVLA